MGFFDAVGKAFSGIGRWGEKQRIALHYGSDYLSDVVPRQQEWLDRYAEEKRRADEEDRFRQQAEDEYKNEERAEKKRKRDLELTNEMLGLAKNIKRAGGDPLTQLDPAAFEGLPLPPEAIASAADYEIGREDEERDEKERKATQQWELIQSQIAENEAQTARARRPEKGEAPPKKMTRKQALAEARQQLRQELGGFDPITGQTPKMPPGAIERRAQELLSGEGVPSAEAAVAGFDANDALLSALSGGKAAPSVPRGTAAPSALPPGVPQMVKYQGKIVPFTSLPPDKQQAIIASMGVK